MKNWYDFLFIKEKTLNFNKWFQISCFGFVDSQSLFRIYSRTAFDFAISNHLIALRQANLGIICKKNMKKSIFCWISKKETQNCEINECIEYEHSFSGRETKVEVCLCQSRELITVWKKFYSTCHIFQSDKVRTYGNSSRNK